jgi:hypothetical protein
MNRKYEINWDVLQSHCKTIFGTPGFSGNEENNIMRSFIIIALFTKCH